MLERPEICRKRVFLALMGILHLLQSGRSATLNTKKQLIPILALAVSAIALVFSQFRPLYTYFAHPKISVVLSNTIGIQQNWGYLSLSQYMQIKNSGTAEGEVTHIEYFIAGKDNANYKIILPAQTYYLKPTTFRTGDIVTQVPMGTTAVDQGTIWDSFVLFYRPFLKADQAKVAQLSLDIRRDIDRQISTIGNGGGLKYVNDSLFTEIQKTVNSNLGKFDRGEYYLLAMFWTDENKRPAIIKCYSLSVFDTDILTLNMITEGYHSGAGVYYPGPPSVGFNTPLIEVKDPSTITDLYESYLSSRQSSK